MTPSSPIEEVLVEIWGSVLSRDLVGVHEDFFALGGDSLAAMRMVSRLGEVFQVELAVSQVFEARTVAALGREVEAAIRAGYGLREPPLEPLPRRGRLPLSFAQERSWFLEQLEPGNPAHVVSAAFEVEGDLELARLAAGAALVIERHEVLRSRFPALDGRAAQRIESPGPAPLALVDTTRLEARDRNALARGAEAREVRRRFDLARGPLVRLTLVRLAAAEHLLVVTLHQIAADGWSLDLFIEELAACYRELATGIPISLPPLPLQYPDFAAWQRRCLGGRTTEAPLAYWRQHLRGAPPVLELPTDRPRPAARSFQTAQAARRLPEALARRLRELPGAHGGTLFMTLLAAFVALLARYSGQHDLVLGMPIASRSRRETERLIGPLVNNVSLRVHLAGCRSFLDLAGRVREAALGAFAHQDLPFEKVVEELQPERTLSHAPLFQVPFVMRSGPEPRFDLPGLSLRRFDTGVRSADYDLVLRVTDLPEALDLVLEYDADLFDATTPARMLANLEALLQALADDPAAPLDTLPLLAAGERQQVTGEWSTAREERPEGAGTVYPLFAARARGAPEAIALLGDGERLSYGELDRRARRLAARLRHHGLGLEGRVALVAERSFEAVTAMLAALEAGVAYLPIDPAAPADYAAGLLEDAGVALVLTHGDGAAALAGTRLPRLEIAVEIAGEAPVAASPPAVDPEGAAYLIYTSGSLGRPKGVVTPHRALASFLCAAGRLLDWRTDDRILWFAPANFDASALQLLVPLTHGGSVVVLPRPGELGSAGIQELSTRLALTVLDLPAARWRQWVDDLVATGRRLEPGVRLYLTGGESISGKKLEAWAERAEREVDFLSSYGPTEATVTTTAFTAGRARAARLGLASVPIGRPLDNARVHLLDGALQPVPVGAAGELAIAGSGLARCYHRRPGWTAAAFLPNPFAAQPGERLYRTGDLARFRPDGTLEFLGRLDDQVKVRGVRIEPAEVEAALLGEPAVREAAVVAWPEPSGQRRLVAYVVPEPGESPLAVRELRAALRGKLPHYMLPSAFVELAALPQLATGKVDRRALPPPPRAEAGTAAGEPPPAAPRDGREALLAALWARELGRAEVGVHDGFFELGGDSLLALSVVARARAMGLDLSVRQLFEHPTVAELAAVVRRIEEPEGGAADGASPLPATAARIPAGILHPKPARRGDAPALLDLTGADRARQRRDHLTNLSEERLSSFTAVLEEIDDGDRGFA